MSHKKKSHTSKPFGGSVELIPPQPALIEFIDSHRIWGFKQLTHFVLEGNPEHHGKSTLPPDQLVLFYTTAIVTLKGWRLELMLGPLVNGRIARLHAEKHLGALIIEEPWVSEIHVTPFDNPGSLERKLEIPITTKRQP
jgi:hypothetical protein